MSDVGCGLTSTIIRGGRAVNSVHCVQRVRLMIKSEINAMDLLESGNVVIHGDW